MKKILLIAGLLLVLAIFFVWQANRAVTNAAKGKLYTSITDSMPVRKVGLLLGTGKYLSDGTLNLYYQYRIEAAAELYKNGKISYILVSGDNSSTDYDEPSTMKTDIETAGVPAERIYLDYAGFRTLDSVVRCKAIFGQDSITIISQPFHNERALYLAEHYDIDAIGYNAKDVTIYYGFKTQIREKIARVKMFLDILFGKKPKFLGEKVVIG